MTKYLRTYIEYQEGKIIKKTDKISCTKCLVKYGGLDLYDENTKKIYTMDHKEINFVKK